MNFNNVGYGFYSASRVVDIPFGLEEGTLRVSLLYDVDHCELSCHVSFNSRSICDVACYFDHLEDDFDYNDFCSFSLSKQIRSLIPFFSLRYLSLFPIPSDVRERIRDSISEFFDESIFVEM